MYPESPEALHGPWKLAIILEILLAELEQFKPLSKLMSQKFPKLHFCPHINTFPVLTRPLCRDWHCFPAPEPAALLFAQGLQLSGTENITELENITPATTISSIFNMHRSMWHLLISVTAQVLFFTTVGTRPSPLEDALGMDISVRHDYQVLTMRCYNGKLGQIQVQGRALLPDHRGWAYLLQRH